MKKILLVLTSLLVAVIAVMACSHPKTETKPVSKAKASRVSSKIQTSSETSQKVSGSSAELATEMHGKTEESEWLAQSSEAAKLMTIDEARQSLREVNIDDSNFSNADLNRYILAAQTAGQDFQAYMLAQNFPTLTD
jgi:uncharacterized protein YxeA